MTLENKYNRGTHGDSSHMLSTVVLSNENQTCRGWEAHTSTGGGGCHSVLSKKIGTFGYSVIQATRRTFFYGILFMIPALFIFDFKWDLNRFVTPAYLFNIFYLGLGASAICFVTWNMAVRILGAIKTSVYIYLAPVVTAVTSVIVLHEKITFLSGVGILLVLGGLLLSEQKKKFFSIRGRKQTENVIE